MKNITSSTLAKSYPGDVLEKNRAWFWMRRALLGLFTLLVVLCTLGATYQAVAARNDQRNFPPPGQLYDVGGYRLHIYCTGAANTGNPAVILDTLSGGSLVNWGWVQPEIAKTTRVCSYDRAGYGWSDPAPQPPSFQATVTNLHTLLSKAGIPGPYILVGHSKGGLIVRGFAASYPSEVAGLVLLDAAQPDQFSRYPDLLVQNKAFEREMFFFPWLARLGLAHLYFEMGGEIDFKDLPGREHDELAAFWSSPEYWETQRADMQAGTDFFAEAHDLGSLGNLPLAVVSAGTNPHPEIQAELAALSTNSIHVTVPGATHASLAFNSKDAGITSSVIEQVVEAVRTGQPVVSK